MHVGRAVEHADHAEIEKKKTDGIEGRVMFVPLDIYVWVRAHSIISYLMFDCISTHFHFAYTAESYSCIWGNKMSKGTPINTSTRGHTTKMQSAKLSTQTFI